MGWTRIMTQRNLKTRHRRPDLESLEVRTLLSLASSQPTPSLGRAIPASSTSSSPTPSVGTPFDTIVGASAARAAYGVDGTGSTVAVIDAGVNYNNSALGGGLGSGDKVVAGYDFTTGSSDPIATTLQHGTSVAGLIASANSSDLGIAPGADIVALKVFDSNNTADFSKVADALQWVIANHSQYHITDVNISISDGNNYPRDWFADDGGVGQKITSLVDQLDAINIPVVTATGNSFTGQQGQDFPSIISNTISVTSTNVQDQIVSDAQRLGSALGGASATTIAAPGDNVLAPGDGNNLALGSGTSFAAPMVSGAVVLMQQVYQQRFGSLPTVDQLKGWLEAGSDPVTDPSTGFTIGRLDIPKAIAQIPNAAAQILTPPVPVTPAPSPVATAPPVAATPPVSVPAPVTAPTPAPVATAPVASSPTTPTSTSSANTSTPPAQAPTWTTGPTSPVSLYVNGQSVTSADLASPSTSTTLSSLPTFLLTALKSLSQWWTGSSADSVQVWSASQPTTGEAAGSLKPVSTHAAKVAALTTKSHLHATSKVNHASATMTRAWHSFAGSKAKG